MCARAWLIDFFIFSLSFSLPLFLFLSLFFSSPTRRLIYFAWCVNQSCPIFIRYRETQAGKYKREFTYLCCGGGVGVRDRGKLATSLVTDSDRIDPNVWSGDKLAPTLCTMPLLKHTKASVDY